MSDHTDVTIRGIIARDDLLHLAHDVAEATSIVPESERLGRTVHVGEGLLAKALQLHLDAAERGDRSIAPADHYECAASILEFCALPGMGEYLPHRPGIAHMGAPAMYEKALDACVTRRGKTDRWHRVQVSHKLSRAYRLAGCHDDAQDVASQSDAFFNATGAGHMRGEFDFQWCAASLTRGCEASSDDGARRRAWVKARKAAYENLNQVWQQDGAGTGVHSGHEHWTTHGQTRNRFEFACALVDLVSGAHGSAPLVDRLRNARILAEQHSPRVFLSHRLRGFARDEVGPATDSLSLTLALVEVLLAWDGATLAGLSPEDEIQRAIARLEDIRLTRHVIARSRGPFAIVLRRILGDIASMLCDLPGRRAAELGFQVALVAKHTGIAAIIRSQSEHLGSQIGRIVGQVHRAERMTAAPEMDTDVARHLADRELSSCEKALEAISPILASWALPEKITTETTVQQLQRRCRTVGFVLDFVGLGRSDSQETQWFRTLLTREGKIEFERVTTGPAFARFFLQKPLRARNLRSEWKSQSHDRDDDWCELAQELLPPALVSAVSRASSDTPLELLISPHGLLNLLPWQALRLSPGGPRLITGAVVTLSPVLSAVLGDPLPAVGDPAFVQLVKRRSGSDEALDLDLEQRAWGLDSADDVVVSQCRRRPRINVPATGTLADSLRGSKFVHLAAHGTGKQLEQRIFLPYEFHSYQAMQTRWPDSVLLAACYLGEDSDEIDEEPLGFATAVLVGGARCVVAARSSIDNLATDALAAHVVEALHDDAGLDLAHALRDAQLARIAELDDDYRIYEWALLSAFVC
jgi:hypothetical protein